MIENQQINFNELLTRKEELNPELAMYLSEDSFISLKHPLVYSVPYSSAFNAVLNEQFKQKSAAVKQAFKDKDFTRYIWLHEKPYRIDMLCAIKNLIDSKTFWELLGSVITDTENMWQQKKSLLLMLESRKHDKSLRYHMMREKDLEVFNKLPDEIEIHRGCIIKNRKGFSWTLSREKAEWFAGRFKQPGHLVLTQMISKKNVYAYFGGRGEEEIFIHPKFVKLKS